jgi:molybdopterin biosynthesis enzyme MoaB
MIRALAITVSNRASAGIYADTSGPVLAGLLREAGCEVDGPTVVPDGDQVEAALRDAVTVVFLVFVNY